MGNPHEAERNAKKFGYINPYSGAGVESYKFWDVALAECKGSPVLGNGGRKEKFTIWI